MTSDQRPRNALVDELRAENRKLSEALEIVQTKFLKLAQAFATAVLEDRDHITLAEIHSFMTGLPKPEWIAEMRAKKASMARTASREAQDPGQSSGQEPRKNDP